MEKVGSRRPSGSISAMASVRGGKAMPASAGILA
ncbi:Uncharacterised protein [Flavonifractor plautii]|uniref:Uncharacterized protein n=1 Tax=Flavonifractor plautii TaxID=292800 RepID=A0A174UWZ0_FLAPL|nr:Uncharacterised protein [Flavonifractor plautii]